MTVNILALLSPTRGPIPKNPGAMRIIPKAPRPRLVASDFLAPTNVAPPADTFTQTVTVKVRQDDERISPTPGVNNKETLAEPYASLADGLDMVMDRLYADSNPQKAGTVYFMHAPSLGEKRKRMFIYTSGSQALPLASGSIEKALRNAGVMPTGQHLQKLTLSTGYQETRATGMGSSRQMGGFGPFHIMFRHGQPVYEAEPSSFEQTLRPEYRESVSRFFDSKDNSFATPKQIAHWIGDALTKGKVTSIETSDWDDQLKLVTLNHHFAHGIGRKVESDRGQLRYQRTFQGPVELKNMRVVVAYHPKHPNELYLYTAYPTP